MTYHSNPLYDVFNGGEKIILNDKVLGALTVLNMKPLDFDFRKQDDADNTCEEIRRTIHD